MEKKRLKPGMHTFVICAYKESPYLEECIVSLQNQLLQSKIIMVTSTPNEHINQLAKKYKLSLFINEGESGIAQDWNFGIGKCQSKFVTIAHQDDIYKPEYLLETMRHLKQREDALISFTDYGELRENRGLEKSVLLFVKRILLLPMCVRRWQSSFFFRRRCISFGNSICCPSVTYCMERLKQPVFEKKYGSNLDWQTWAALAEREGAFVYIRKILMYHRIHEESATSGLIKNRSRAREDKEMLERFWPAPVAGLLARFYSYGEKLNGKKK